MTTTIVLVDNDDAWLQSDDVNYTTVLDGSVSVVNGSSNLLAYGQYYVVDPAPVHVALQSFMRFIYTQPANEVVTSAAFNVVHSEHYATGVSRALLFYSTTYGPGSPVNADWVTPPEFAALARYARFADAQASGLTQRIWAGSDELTNALATNGSQTVSVVAASDRQILYGAGPSSFENDSLASSQVAGRQPLLVVSTTPRSTLHGVLGAQVRLSDGTWAVLESNGLSTPTITLRHVNSVGTATTKATVPTGVASTDFAFGSAAGAQQLALIVDASDNLFVVGRRGDSENTLAVKAYVKGVGYSWTAATMLSAAMPANASTLNNFAGAWHSVGNGTLVAWASRTSGDSDRQFAYETICAVLSAPAALAGSGTLVREALNALGNMLPQVPYQPWSCNTNETGTGLDVAAITSTKGVAYTWARREGLGVNQPAYKCRYTLQADGTRIQQSFGNTITDGGPWAKKTAAGKLRALPIAADQAVFVGADAETNWGITPWAARTSGTSTLWTHLGYVLFGSESISTMPAAATLAESAAWDVTYRTSDSKVWAYYFDTGNGRRLMRTAMALASYSATREEIELSSTVGASGSTNLAIRTTRATATPNAELVTIANRTSGGAHSTIYLVDDPNIAPTAPTLGPRSNFDASASARFTWTFNDPNPTDTQASFELDINSASGVDYYDTGRLNGAITYVGAGSAFVGNNTNLSPTLPASAAAGDLLLLLASIRNHGTGTVGTPTGWRLLASGVNGNLRLFGRHMLSGAASANNLPTVAFASGVVNATTLAQISAWRGTDQDITTVVTATASGSFISAQNLPWSALTIPASSHVGIRAGWKQDDWTSVAANAGFTSVGSTTSTTGDDASQIWEYQTGTLGWFGGSWVVTGGAAAISASLSVAIRPYQAPTTGGFTVPASTLTQPGSWQWRVKTWDAAGAEGAWSNYQSFTTGPGAVVTVTDPATDNPANFLYSSYGVDWTVTGATQADYRVVVKRTDTEAEVYNSGWVTSTATTHTVTGLISGIEQRIEVTARTSGLIESNTGTRLVTPEFAVPETPLVSATANDDLGYTLISVTHPTPTGDRPDAVHANILRRATTGSDAGEDWLTIGAVLPGSTWRDYTAGALTYEYTARAVAADGTYSEADPVTATLALAGVWIHNPTDPQTTIRQYAYGGPAKSVDVDPMGTATYFDGRPDPVVDYGEHRDEQFNVKIDVPHGTDWRTQLDELRAFNDARTTVCVRDVRGRRVLGAIEGYSERDQGWGSEVSFRARRVSYDETYTDAPI